MSNDNADDYLGEIADDFLTSADGDRLTSDIDTNLEAAMQNALANHGTVEHQWAQYGEVRADIWKDGHRYQKAGIMLGDFFSQGVAQLNLFDENAPRAGSEKLMNVLDHLNTIGGKGTLFFAGQGIEQKWQMKREMLSPRYTTRFSELLKLK